MKVSQKNNKTFRGFRRYDAKGICKGLNHVINTSSYVNVLCLTRHHHRYSAVLELMDFIRTENIKSLILHVVEKFGDRLVAAVDYVDTFNALKTKYDQVQNHDYRIQTDS